MQNTGKDPILLEHDVPLLPENDAPPTLLAAPPLEDNRPVSGPRRGGRGADCALLLDLLGELAEVLPVANEVGVVHVHPGLLHGDDRLKEGKREL